MEFDHIESVYYIVLFAVATFAGLARVWRDNEQLGLRRGAGRCVSSGILSFGICAIWIGYSPVASGPGCFFYLGAAALIGWMSKDLQDQLLNRLIAFGLRRSGIDEKKPDDKSG